MEKYEIVAVDCYSEASRNDIEVLTLSDGSTLTVNFSDNTVTIQRVSE